MLQQSTHPIGSRAMLQGAPVTIRQWLADGRALVFGLRNPYRAEPDELDPVPARPLLDAWVQERIARVGNDVATSTITAYDDYCAFAARAGSDDREIKNRRNFAYALRTAGYLSTWVRATEFPANQSHGAVRAWRFSLVPGPLGGAA